MAECLFCKIAAQEVPATVVWRDEKALAFRDINPQAPTHILIIPLKHVAGLDEAGEEDRELLGHLLLLARRLADSEGLEQGYRLVVNNGSGAGQSVFHLHLHLLGGRGFKWPPG